MKWPWIKCVVIKEREREREYYPVVLDSWLLVKRFNPYTRHEKNFNVQFILQEIWDLLKIYFDLKRKIS